MLAVGGPFQGGRTITELVSLIDLPVTLLDCAGIKKPEDFQGNSLKSLADGTSKGWDDCVFIPVSYTHLVAGVIIPCSLIVPTKSSIALSSCTLNG